MQEKEKECAFGWGTERFYRIIHKFYPVLLVVFSSGGTTTQINLALCSRLDIEFQVELHIAIVFAYRNSSFWHSTSETLGSLTIFKIDLNAIGGYKMALNLWHLQRWVQLAAYANQDLCPRGYKSPRS